MCVCVGVLICYAFCLPDTVWGHSDTREPRILLGGRRPSHGGPCTGVPFPLSGNLRCGFYLRFSLSLSLSHTHTKCVVTPLTSSMFPFSLMCRSMFVDVQDCSASICERNWSTWALIHTKKRNRLSVKQQEKLVFCSTNARLAARLKTITIPLQVVSRSRRGLLLCMPLHLLCIS